MVRRQDRVNDEDSKQIPIVPKCVVKISSHAKINKRKRAVGRMIIRKA